MSSQIPLSLNEISQYITEKKLDPLEQNIIFVLIGNFQSVNVQFYTKADIDELIELINTNKEGKSLNAPYLESIKKKLIVSRFEKNKKKIILDLITKNPKETPKYDKSQITMQILNRNTSINRFEITYNKNFSYSDRLIAIKEVNNLKEKFRKKEIAKNLQYQHERPEQVSQSKTTNLDKASTLNKKVIIQNDTEKKDIHPTQPKDNNKLNSNVNELDARNTKNNLKDNISSDSSSLPPFNKGSKSSGNINSSSNNPIIPSSSSGKSDSMPQNENLAAESEGSSSTNPKISIPIVDSSQPIYNEESTYVMPEYLSKKFKNPYAKFELKFPGDMPANECPEETDKEIRKYYLYDPRQEKWVYVSKVQRYLRNLMEMYDPNDCYLKECEICFQIYDSERDGVKLKECGCLVHYDCFIDHIIETIKKNGYVYRCFRCNQVLADSTIKSNVDNFVDENLKTSYSLRMRDKEIIMSLKGETKKMYCITKECGCIARCSENDPKVYCDGCKITYCRRCGLIFKRDHNCAKENNLSPQEQQMVNESCLAAGMKRCPFCKIWTEKKPDSIIIECSCGSVWCWNCGITIIKGTHICPTEEVVVYEEKN